jgi:diguanylate cyclase (GGDEF)-like protein
LQIVARRLSRSVRASDTVARVGGDEFVVLLEGVHCQQDVARIAEKLRLVLTEPMQLAGQQVEVSPSIGIAHYPGDGDDERALLHSADTAMYLAKRGGGNQCRGSGIRTDASPHNENGHPEVPVLDLP